MAKTFEDFTLTQFQATNLFEKSKPKQNQRAIFQIVMGIFLNKFYCLLKKIF